MHQQTASMLWSVSGLGSAVLKVMAIPYFIVLVYIYLVHHASG